MPCHKIAGARMKVGADQIPVFVLRAAGKQGSQCPAKRCSRHCGCCHADARELNCIWSTTHTWTWIFAWLCSAVSELIVKVHRKLRLHHTYELDIAFCAWTHHVTTGIILGVYFDTARICTVIQHLKDHHRCNKIGEANFFWIECRAKRTGRLSM